MLFGCRHPRDMEGSRRIGEAFHEHALETAYGCQLKGDLRGIDFVERTIQEVDLDIHHRIAGVTPRCRISFNPFSMAGKN